MNFCGLPIQEHPLVPDSMPKIQLSPNFKWCSEQFRAEMNIWLLEMFGKQDVAFVINPSAAELIGEPTLLMHSRHYAMLTKLAYIHDPFAFMPGRLIP